MIIKNYKFQALCRLTHAQVTYLNPLTLSYPLWEVHKNVPPVAPFFQPFLFVLSANLVPACVFVVALFVLQQRFLLVLNPDTSAAGPSAHFAVVLVVCVGRGCVCRSVIPLSAIRDSPIPPSIGGALPAC